MLARMSDEQLFSMPTRASDDELLISVYQKQSRTLDDLPYTPEFVAIAQALGADTMTQQAALFRRLHTIRKAGKLPRMGKASESRPRIEREQEAILAGLVEQAVGRLSLRDQLPYTPAFDQIVEQFNARAGLTLSPHNIWRLIAKLAK